GGTTRYLAEGFASAPGGAAPEPATWALTIAGFGLAGAALRRRRAVAAA
ncbi:MAG: PEPxxWA-CTERM sorting domain-containing protein, partial [Proteobacteria bacterium]|nr:PEPxxWA-CTERM sorting domain-containing protein [Pseudomonadota bacterium]